MILEDIFSYSDTGGFMRFLSFFYSFRNKIMITVGVILIFLLAVFYASLWVLFTKAERKGYAGVIPFYNLLVLLQITGLRGYHFFLILIPGIGLYSNYIICKELARVFMQKPSYGVLLFWFPYIFLPKLALGNSKYDKNYYYKSVNDSSNNEYVIVNTEVSDYNQGLIFDPKTNVDDVVKSAPYDPTLSNFFKDKDESENEFMAFLDMSDDARQNEQNNMGGFTAQPNNFVEQPVVNNMNEVPQGGTPDEPNKMSVEALLGRPTTEDINMPKVEAPQAPPVDMNNLFNVGMSAPVQNNMPTVDMNNQLNVQQPVMDGMVTTPVSNPPIMTDPAQQPVEEEGISQEAAQNINADINKILGLDVNNIESVPVQNVTPDIPTLGGSVMPPTNPVEVHQATDLVNGGNNLVQNAVDFASTQTPPTVASPTMCPNCGTTLPAGAKFCYMCGKAI